MFRQIAYLLPRELSPFEKLVLGLMCEGKSNSSIAKLTSHTEKVVENTISRSARIFGIKSDGDTNLRVLLALAFRANFGDDAFDQLDLPCKNMVKAPDGTMICHQHIH